MAKRRDDATEERVCAFCEHGTPVPRDTEGNTLVLCDKKGLVRENGVCRRFSYDPLKREPAEIRAVPEFKAIDIDG